MADAPITPVSQVAPVSGVGPQGQAVPEPGTLLSGTIVGRDANGNFLLRTAGGNLSLQSNLPLTYNSDVVIRMEASGQTNVNSAKIVSVNGEPFAEFVQQQPQEDSVSSTLLSQTSQSAPAESLPASPQTNILRAIVISAPASDSNIQPQTASGAPAITTGAEVVIRLPQTAVPTSQETFSPAAPPEAAPQPLTTVQHNSPEQTAIPLPVLQATETPLATPQLQISPEPLPANSNFINEAISQQAQQVNIPAPAISIPLPGTEVPPPARTTAQNPLYAIYARQSSLSNLPVIFSQNSMSSSTINNTQANPVPIPGEIISATRDGIITLQTSMGIITVKATSLLQSEALNPGMNVTVDFPDNTSQLAALPQPVSSYMPAPLAEIAASWSTLKEIFGIVSEKNTTAIGQEQSDSLLTRLPVLDENFASSSLSFITALASGDVRKILGENAANNLRENGRADLLQKFAGELMTVSDSFSPKTEQMVPGWQATFLPFVFGEEMQQARIYVKRDLPNKKQQGGGARSGTRFILEVSLPEFGGVQMDGLIRKMQAGTIFDLMIRSNTGFSRQEQADIITIYKNAAEQTGFSGTLGFQVTGDFPVKPLDDLLADQENTITV